MDEGAIKPKRPRAVATPRTGSAGAANGQASKSSHVIDLRQNRPAAGAQGPSAAARPAGSQKLRTMGGARPMATRAAAPVAPAARPQPTPQAAPASAPVLKPALKRKLEPEVLADPFSELDEFKAATQPVDTSLESALEPAVPSEKRFWPAFWRFLFLLILLGIIIAGGIYLYLNYVANQ